jgi:hypothetical protein
MLRVRSSRFLEVSIYNNVGLSDVHNIHPVHPFLEKRVKPASRSHNPHEPDDAGAYENVDESCKQLVVYLG